MLIEKQLLTQVAVALHSIKILVSSTPISKLMKPF